MPAFEWRLELRFEPGLELSFDSANAFCFELVWLQAFESATVLELRLWSESQTASQLGLPCQSGLRLPSM